MKSVHPFDLLMELPLADIRLDCAALHVARDVYPYIHVPDYVARLDAIAERVAARRPGLSAPLRYEAMRGVLVDELGFRGNTEDYYDPQNSYLSRVLDRRVGLPITLSIVWMEIARRLKWSVEGVAFPGHFLVRFDDPDHFVLADPFNGGQSLTVEECAAMLNVKFDGKVSFTDEFLEPADTKIILTRLLNNLRLIYLMDGNWQRLAETLRRLSAVEPGNRAHTQELAAIDRYVDQNAAGADPHAVRHHFRTLAAAMLYRN